MDIIQYEVDTVIEELHILKIEGLHIIKLAIINTRNY